MQRSPRRQPHTQEGPARSGRTRDAGDAGGTPAAALRFALGLALAAGLLAAPAAGHAQVVYGTYERDTNETDILFLGGTVGLPGNVMGLSPYFAIGAYRLSYPVDNGTTTVLGVTPAAGLAQRFTDGSATVSLGYQFQSTDDAAALPFFGGRGSGVTTGASLNYAPSPLALEGLLAYNWGSSYLWSRARGLVSVLPLPNGALRVGGDVVWQGEMDGTDPYRATQFGPTIQAGVAPGLSLGAGFGWKTSTAQDDATYFRLEFGYAIPR
jgi:hypothetical protein